jgi:DNA-binding beta-propeller fold protein YncE
VRLLLLLLAACRPSPPAPAIALPDGRPGIGFDDLRWSARWGVLAPAGRSGAVDLVKNDVVTAITGFAADPLYFGGHGQGPTSVDEGAGLMFVIDRTTEKISVVDPGAQRILSQTGVAAAPDYARFVAATNEVWVTEPDAQQIEIFRLDGSALVHAALLPVPGGPESLVVANTTAYTHLWAGTTRAFDVATRAGLAEWPNGCVGSRGIALDYGRNWLFSGCAEGRGTVVDVRTGQLLGSVAAAAGVDVIDYSPTLQHLYLPAETLTIASISPSGEASPASVRAAVAGAHCAVTDDGGHVWVCDPDNGDLLRYDDP